MQAAITNQPINLSHRKNRRSHLQYRRKCSSAKSVG